MNVAFIFIIARVLQVQIAPIRVCVKDVTDPSLTASSCAWTTARGTRSVCSARCVSSFSPWAATPETRNSTANTTTNSKSWFTPLPSCVSSSVARRDISLRLREFWCVCVYKWNISKRLFFVVLWDSVVFFFPTRILRLGYKIQAYYLYFKIINYQRTWLQIIVVVITVIIRKCLPIFVRIL